jgi:hypothetical protein
MKRLVYFIAAITGMITLFSCEQTHEESWISFGETSDLIIRENAEITASVHYDGSSLNLSEIIVNERIKLKSANRDNNDFTLEATVNSPIIENSLLSASFVEIFKSGDETRAYVTYNLSGAAHGGAVIVVDLSNPQSPRITGEIIFPDIDINVCEVYRTGKMLWLGGSSFKKGAVIVPIELDAKGDILLSNGKNTSFNLITIKNVASVNGIVEAGDWLMTTAGNFNGGTFALNYKKGYRVDGIDNFPNAKFSTANGNTLGKYHASLEGGENAKLRVYRVGVQDEENAVIIPIGSIYHATGDSASQYSGKATCYMEKNSRYCYVSKGANGFAAVDIFEKSIVATSSPELLKSGNVNSICVDSKYIYLANGADGLVICEKPEIVEGSTEVAGVKPAYKWDEETEGASANYVAVHDEYLFVAKGANGGLKIIKRLFE